jgi:uncharacterized GH25 family protein
MIRYFLCGLFVTLSFGANADAHYHMLIANKPSIKSDEEVVVVYQFGHPFEHELADAQEPASALIHRPDGTVLDAKDKFRKIEIAGAKGAKHVGFQLTYKPEQRGDHILVVVASPVMLEGEKLPVHDTVKTIIHVQTENGWDSHVAHGKDQPADLVPLTRPYGLRAGMIFRAAFYDLVLKPNAVAAVVPHSKVEIERYNPAAPKELPPEEHITYSARTDEKGVVSATLPDPGWWAVTAIKSTPKAIHRCTLWIHVDGKIPLKPAD